MKKVPVILWPIVGIFFLLVIIAAFIFRVPHLSKISSLTSSLIPGESLKISDITFNQDYKNGEGGWELIAEEARFFDTNQMVYLKDVLLTLNSLEKNSYIIKGNEGDYCRKSEEIILKGNVVGRSAKGYQIETSMLVYKQKSESVVTDKPVRLIGPFFQVEGDGLFLDLKKNTYKVKQNVYTTIEGGNVY